MTRDPGRQVDGVRSTSRGVNCGAAPDLIGKDYLSFAVNTTVRGGFPQSRPGFRKLEIDYGGNEDLQDGLFQGAEYFKPRGGAACLVASISGRLFRFDLGSTNTVANISVRTESTFDYNAVGRRQAWMLQAEDWLIVQDSDSRPIFYNGTSSRRAGFGEMRVGAMMEYSNGRVWVVRPDRKSFAAGDIVYGPSGTTAYNFRDGVLKDQENTFLTEGGDFTVPLEAGQINAIRNIAVLDTSMGIGPLQVLTSRAVFSVNAPPDRTTWKDLSYPIGTVTLIGNGSLSQDSTVSINGDIWYRSADGIRSLIIGHRQFSDWGNVPMSREMNLLIEADDSRLLNFSSSILFQNRLLMTCSPAMAFDHGTYHRGLIALDFDIVSSMSTRLPPAYDGLWTGIRILKLLTGDFDGVARAFAFVLSSEDKIELWEISATDIFDNASRRIDWYYETPALFDGLTLRKLMGGEMFIDRLSGTADFDIKWRPDDYAGWFDLHSWSECAQFQTCSLEGCATPSNFQPQYRSKMRFPVPPDSCVSEDNRPASLAYRFQLRVGVSGRARVKALAAHALVQHEEPYGQCRPEGECISSVVCNLPVFSYSSESS